jgi:hypothetical protein
VKVEKAVDERRAARSRRHTTARGLVEPHLRAPRAWRWRWRRHVRPRAPLRARHPPPRPPISVSDSALTMTKRPK